MRFQNILNPSFAENLCCLFISKNCRMPSFLHGKYLKLGIPYLFAFWKNCIVKIRWEPVPTSPICSGGPKYALNLLEKPNQRFGCPSLLDSHWTMGPSINDAWTLCVLGIKTFGFESTIWDMEAERFFLVFNRGDTVSRRSSIEGVRPSPYTTLCS